MLEKNSFHIVVTACLLFFVIAVFQFTELDIFVQNFFYDFETKNWLLDKHDTVVKFIFYDGIKKLLIVFALSVIISLIFFRKANLIRKYKQGLIIVALSAICVPAVVGALKSISNTPCPCNMVHYDGKYPDIKVFDTYPKSFLQTSNVKCWPAGHASGGFALLSLFFLFKTKRNKILGLTGALAIGWSMGMYKMLIGDHFLSHTIITMIIAWLIILVLKRVIQK